MDKEKIKKTQKKVTEIENELTNSFEHGIVNGCRKAIEVAAKYTFLESNENEKFFEAAANRLAILMGYCAFNEQPFSSEIAIRILRESETDEEMQKELQYDYSDEFQRSVNEVLCTCLNFYTEVGNICFATEE